MNLNSLRADVEALTSSLTRIRYLAASGEAATLDQSGAFQAYPHVATWEAFGLVQEALARAEGRRAGRLRALLHHVYSLIEDAATASAAGARQAALVAPVPGTEAGETVPAGIALEELAQVGDREKRSLFERRVVDALAAEVTPASREIESLQSVAQKAGFVSTVAAHGALSGLDITALIADVESFLSNTAAMYDDVLSWWMRRTAGLRLFPHGAERHDLLHALALMPLDGLFPRGESVVALSGNLSAMGLSPRADGRIRIDGASRPAKAPTPVAAPIDPPREVMAVFRPRSGHAGTRDLLRCLGTAQHYANIAEERPFEDRAIGDRAVPLAMGALFELWLLDRRWLKRILDAEWPDLVRVLTLVALSRLRLEAVRLLHTIQMDREGLGADRGRQYAERMASVMRVAWPEGLWLHDVDVRLGGLDELRASALAIGWAEHLREPFDEDWWRNPATGPYLKRTFSQGQVERAPELAERLGLGPMSLDRARRWFEAALAR